MADGPGVSIVHFSGIVDTLLVTASTPIDAQTDRDPLRLLRARHGRRGDQLERRAGVRRRRSTSQFAEDKPIWEHKAHLVRPALADTDGPFMKFRKWYAQFYAEPVSDDRLVFPPPAVARQDGRRPGQGHRLREVRRGLTRQFGGGYSPMAKSDPEAKGATGREGAVAGQVAAVDRELGAGDVAGLVGGEEQDDRGDVVDRADPLERQVLVERRLGLVHALEPGHRRVDAARVHRVHPDAVAAEVDGGRLGQAPHRPLARRRRRRGSGRPTIPPFDEMLMIEPPPAWRIDGATVLMPRNVPMRLTSITWRNSVDVLLVDRAEVEDAGVVDEDRDRAEALLGVGDAASQSSSSVTSRCR